MRYVDKIIVSSVFYTIFLLVTWACTNEEKQTSMYMQAISAGCHDIQALDSIRQVVSTHATDAERTMLLTSAIDSTDEMFAATMFITLLPDSAAVYMITHPRPEALTRLADIYVEAGDSAGYRALRSSLVDKFNTLTADQAADFLVNMATPTQNALGLQPGDEELEQALYSRYKGTEAEIFRAALQSNRSYLSSRIQK